MFNKLNWLIVNISSIWVYIEEHVTFNVYIDHLYILIGYNRSLMVDVELWAYYTAYYNWWESIDVYPIFMQADTVVKFLYRLHMDDLWWTKMMKNL